MNDEKISIRECLLKKGYITNKTSSIKNRFNLDKDSIKIIDEYNELPKISFTNIDEAEDFTRWLNKNIKPKNILEILHHEKNNNEKIWLYLSRNGKRY